MTVPGESGKSGLHVQMHVEFIIKLEQGKSLSTSVGGCNVRDKELRERNVMHSLMLYWNLTGAKRQCQNTLKRLKG